MSYMLHMNKIVSFMLIFFFIIGSFVAVFNPVYALVLVEDSWNTKMSMSQERANLGVVVDGKIYAIGGYTTVKQEWWGPYQAGFCGTNERYDPKTDTWVTLESMPTSRSNFAIAAYQGKIYCIGGEVLDEPGAYRMYRVVEVYDIVTDSWSVKNDAPFDGLGIQAQVIDGKIFVIKGQNLFMYNPITDEWTQKISIPRPDDISNDSVPFAIFSVVVDNKIMIYFKYLPEGSSSIPPNRLKGKIMIYDAKTDAWSEVTKFSEVISGIVWGTTGVYAPKKVYISGQSYNDYGTEDTFGTWVYDPVKNTWSAVKIDPTTLPITYRDQFGVTVVDDILYVIGGQNSTSTETGFILSLNEQYVPIGYHIQPSTVAPPISTGTISPNPSKPDSTMFFLTGFVIVTAIVLTICVIVTALFLPKRKQKNKRDKYE